MLAVTNTVARVSLGGAGLICLLLAVLSWTTRIEHATSVVLNGQFLSVYSVEGYGDLCAVVLAEQESGPKVQFEEHDEHDYMHLADLNAGSFDIYGSSFKIVALSYDEKLIPGINSDFAAVPWKHTRHRGKNVARIGPLPEELATAIADESILVIAVTTSDGPGVSYSNSGPFNAFLLPIEINKGPDSSFWLWMILGLLVLIVAVIVLYLLARKLRLFTWQRVWKKS